MHLFQKFTNENNFLKHLVTQKKHFKQDIKLRNHYSDLC